MQIKNVAAAVMVGSSLLGFASWKLLKTIGLGASDRTHQTEFKLHEKPNGAKGIHLFGGSIDFRNARFLTADLSTGVSIQLSSVIPVGADSGKVKVMLQDNCFELDGRFGADTILEIRATGYR